MRLRKIENLKEWLDYAKIIHISSNFSNAGVCNLYINGKKVEKVSSGGYGYDKTSSSLSQLVTLLLKDLVSEKIIYKIASDIESSSYYSINVNNSFFSLKQLSSIKDGDFYEFKIKSKLEKLAKDSKNVS